MASGRFHGGSTHSGGFHSSGGGGGFHSSGWGSGGGSFRSSGSSDGYSSDRDSFSEYGPVSETDRIVYTVILAIGGIFVLIYFFSPLLNLLTFSLVTLPVFIVCSVLLFFGLKESKRTVSIRRLLKNGPTRTPGHVWSRKQKNKDVTDGKSFYGARKTYDINLFDPDFGDANSQKVYDMVIMTPGIIWIKPAKLLGGAVISFIVNIFFGPMVIYALEDSVIMNLGFIRLLLFFLPSIVCLILSAYSLIVVKIKDDLLYKCAVRIVEDNNANKKHADTVNKTAYAASPTWYYNICPNCGTKATERDKVCSRCDSSLEADFKSGGRPSSCHRVFEYNPKKKPVSEGEVKEKTDP